MTKRSPDFTRVMGALSPGELDDLARKLDLVTTDLVVRLAIAGEPWSRMGVAGPHVQSQPCSRPPYNIGADIVREALWNELGTTIRVLCEHRGVEVPAFDSLVAAAGWLRQHRVAFSTMDAQVGRELAFGVMRAIDSAVRSVGVVDQEYRIPDMRAQIMIATANQHQVDAGRVEKLAHKLGDQAKGLNRRRVDYLRRSGQLMGEWDEETGKWWYRLGDVLAAHKRARLARVRRGA
ncbi:hypothetical protein [Gordonia sp. N1V]|uniref:hypothetical protein n=1 Tax=Gordonia sp. N1V TaxID=3034163 RepID=UPI0023E10331|nr:hypothetical protein [Gordonia sp. N1V]MDF3280469.1 hypothetical protein [Gordonia sp. N1V]